MAMEALQIMKWLKAVAKQVVTNYLNQIRVLRTIAQALSLTLVGGSVVSGQPAMDGQYIYAAQDDGTLHVYDINNSHQPVKTITVFSPAGDVRGACASAATHRFYVLYNLNSNGHVACIDLTTDQ